MTTTDTSTAISEANLSTSKTDPAVLRERVVRGVRWLDEHRPDWVDHVEVRELDMVNPCRCVLGQVFEDETKVHGDPYLTGLALGKETTGHDANEDDLVWADAYGFDAELDEDFRSLQNLWEAIILARKATQ